jgi:hypothetical protein
MFLKVSNGKCTILVFNRLLNASLARISVMTDTELLSDNPKDFRIEDLAGTRFAAAIFAASSSDRVTWKRCRDSVLRLASRIFSQIGRFEAVTILERNAAILGTDCPLPQK